MQGSGDGLQQTRTALAWRRTVASAGAAAALVAHHAVVSERGPRAALLLVGAAIAPVGLAIAGRMRRHGARASACAIGLCAGSVVVLALVALGSG